MAKYNPQPRWRKGPETLDAEGATAVVKAARETTPDDPRAQARAVVLALWQLTGYADVAASIAMNLLTRTEIEAVAWEYLCAWHADGPAESELVGYVPPSDDLDKETVQ